MAYSPSAAEPSIASPAETPPDARAEPDAGGEQDGHHDDRQDRGDPARDDPAGPRQRRGEHHPRAGPRSRPRPISRRTSPPRTRPRCRTARRTAGGSRWPTRGRSSGRSCAKVLSRSGLSSICVGHRPDERGQDGAHDAEPDAPRQRSRQLVAERPADRAPDAEDRRRAVAGSDSPAVTPRSRRVNSSTADGEEDDGRRRRRAPARASRTRRRAAMWSAVQWNGLIAASGPPRSRPLATHSTIMTRPATPAAPARPRTGARAKARPPKKRAMKPTQSAKPKADSGGIWSPSAASPNSVRADAWWRRRGSASPGRASSGARPASRARSGACRTASTATKSRLPRPASPASVPDSARIDHSAVPRAKTAPYFQLM